MSSDLDLVYFVSLLPIIETSAMNLIEPSDRS